MISPQPLTSLLPSLLSYWFPSSEAGLEQAARFLVQKSPLWGACALGRNRDSPNSVETEHVKETTLWVPAPGLTEKTDRALLPTPSPPREVKVCILLRCDAPSKQLWAPPGASPECTGHLRMKLRSV